MNFTFKQRFLVIVGIVVLAAICLPETVLADVQAAESADNLIKESLLMTLAGIFLIGLMLNLTPCVYPMLAITVSIFGQQSETSSKSGFFRALLYVVGIATMYSILGLIAALTGGLFGSILQSPWVLLAISLLFFILSLSMFGFYELQVPSSLLNKLGGARSAGLVGIYLSGLFVGIFAAPCVGPPVIALLTLVGQKADPFYGFMVFFVLSMGLGFPYLILGTFSSLLQKLPKSGNWMLWFKKLLGIVLVATGCFYLSLAFKPELTFTLIPLTLLIGGLYLGFLDPVGSKSAAFRIFRYIMGATLIFAAIYSWNIGQKPTFAWQPYSSTINRNQKPTAIYFSASWCIPCLELDRKTFTDQEVIENMQKLNRYKVDLTNYGSEESVKLRRKYSISGVPTLVFLDPDGIEVSHERVVGYIPPEVMNPKIERILTNSPPPEVTPNQPEQVASKPSEISLIADTATIEAGKSFKLGVLFQMQKDWYVYWKNPGDSGTPPQINWSLPEGFEIGEPEWPTPQRFDKPPFATYGFANLLLLAFPVSVPEKIENLTELEFKAEASWLVCREICIGQQGEAGLILPLAGQQTETRPEIDAETKAMFEQTASSIPLPEASWKISAKHDSRSVTLEIIKPEETSDSESLQIDFYPSQQGLFRHGGIKTRPVDQSFEIIMPRSGLPLPEKLHGILVIQNQGESQGKGFIKVIDLNL